MPNDTPFQSAVVPQVISVTELNLTVSRLLERSIPLCWISGEVSNFTRASSGHWYFTLKDAQSQVRAVMFKSRAIATDFLPHEGEKIEVRATTTLYAPRGDYQLNVEAIRRAGLGNLYEAFLQLKAKLHNAGLFDQQSKRPLPHYPARIGIVTSREAAALRDILITLKRRAPHVGLIIYPTPVQGAGAAQKIAQAIELAGARKEVDVLIVARGGGSIEDLWSFNDEKLAYTIRQSPIPIVTGIGHETDFTIADFVADVRAPTPTAAAEMAVMARAELVQQVERLAIQLQRSLRYRLDQQSQTLDMSARRLISPLAYIRHERSRLNALVLQLKQPMLNSRRQVAFQLEQHRRRLITQAPNAQHYRTELEHVANQLQIRAQQLITSHRGAFDHLRTQLDLLNPQRTLERGYAIIQNGKGHILRQPGEFADQERLSVQVAGGQVRLDIAKVVWRNEEVK